MIRTRILAAAFGLTLAMGGVALAEKPVRDVSGARHPNLAAAQRLSRQAFNKVVAAQSANEWDLGGHAQKAKELLDQVNIELKLAAEVSNARHR